MSIAADSVEYAWRSPEKQFQFDAEFFDLSVPDSDGLSIHLLMLLLRRATIYHLARFVEDNQMGVGAWVDESLTCSSPGFDRWCLATMCCAVLQLPHPLLQHLDVTRTEMLDAIDKQYGLSKESWSAWRQLAVTQSESGADKQEVRIRWTDSLDVPLFVTTKLGSEAIRHYEKQVNLRSDFPSALSENQRVFKALGNLVVEQIMRTTIATYENTTSETPDNTFPGMSMGDLLNQPVDVPKKQFGSWVFNEILKGAAFALIAIVLLGVGVWRFQSSVVQGTIATSLAALAGFAAVSIYRDFRLTWKKKWLAFTPFGLTYSGLSFSTIPWSEITHLEIRRTEPEEVLLVHCQSSYDQRMVPLSDKDIGFLLPVAKQIMARAPRCEYLQDTLLGVTYRDYADGREREIQT